MFPCPRACLRIWSRETGSAVPSRVSLLISILRPNLVLTYGIPLEFRGGVHLFIYNRHTPSSQSRVYRVTQLRTDGVHCRESAGTGPVNLKVVPNGCCLGSITMDQFIFASLSHTHSWYEVGMLKVPAYVERIGQRACIYPRSGKSIRVIGDRGGMSCL